MRSILSLITLVLGGFGFWWVGQHYPQVYTIAREWLEADGCEAIETHYLCEQIMDLQRKEVLKDGRCRFLESQIALYPYLLLEVKYSPSPGKCKEAIILWDLSDGEMILDTKTWEKTHGLQDCLKSRAQSSDLQLLQVIAKKGGSATYKQIAKSLEHLSSATLDSKLKHCVQTHLILEHADRYILHMQQPKFAPIPETKLHDSVLLKKHFHGSRMPKTFSCSQVEKLAKDLFPSNFSIRKVTLTYLPVHQIVVEKSDGSIQTSQWNAFNGKQFVIRQ